MSKKGFFSLVLIILAAVLLTACASKTDTPAAATEAYWQALVAKDSAALTNLSCAAHESTALTTLDSLMSVEIKLQDMKCATSENAGDAATVNCTGALVISYGAEDLTIDLGMVPYNVVRESGDWRMCGEK
jgi:PBP1b-binding outer membrane lipoprotein LpoB